jgi:hypothetical protein
MPGRGSGAKSDARNPYVPLPIPRRCICRVYAFPPPPWHRRHTCPSITVSLVTTMQVVSELGQPLSLGRSFDHQPLTAPPPPRGCVLSGPAPSASPR